tara:strand:+ start:4911 stop:5600 length:690 start_codon:yes stop_codon:yes gene_type:complete
MIKKIKLSILFLSISFYSIAQNAWSVYEWKVQPQDVSTVFNICNDYLSQQGNVTEGTTVALYEVMFAGDGFEATHTLNIYGDMESMNRAYSNEQDSDWFLFIEKLNQFIDPVASLAGRALKAYNEDDDSDPIHQLWIMNVSESDKFVDGWTNFRDKYPPNNFIELGTIVSGREDGMTHYILSAQKDFKDLVDGSNWSDAESVAWAKFRKERGQTEMVRSFARRLIKKWN